MGLYDTIAEYDAEIAIVRTQIHNAMAGEEFQINTSQTNQRVRMASLPSIQKYLELLSSERRSLANRLSGASVVSIVPRRSY